MTDEDESGEEGGRSTTHLIGKHTVYRNIDTGEFYVKVDGEIISAATIEDLEDELSSRQPRPR